MGPSNVSPYMGFTDVCRQAQEIRVLLLISKEKLEVTAFLLYVQEPRGRTKSLAGLEWN